MRRKLCELVLIFLFYLMHVTVGRVISIAYISPNWMIILPVFFGFFGGKNEGMFVGFFSGIMYDMYFSGLFGFAALVFVYVGFISGLFFEKYEIREILIPIALVLAADFGFEFLCYIGNFLLHNRLDVGFYVSRFIMPETVYTAFIALIVYNPVYFIDAKVVEFSNRKRKGVIDEGSI